MDTQEEVRKEVRHTLWQRKDHVKIQESVYGPHQSHRILGTVNCEKITPAVPATQLTVLKANAT